MYEPNHLNLTKYVILPLRITIYLFYASIMLMFAAGVKVCLVFVNFRGRDNFIFIHKVQKIAKPSDFTQNLV